MPPRLGTERPGLRATTAAARRQPRQGDRQEHGQDSARRAARVRHAAGRTDSTRCGRRTRGQFHRIGLVPAPAEPADSADHYERRGKATSEPALPVQHVPPSRGSEHSRQYQLGEAAASLKRGFRDFAGFRAAGLQEAGFAQRPAGPGEPGLVPAGERRDRRPLAGGVDHPAAAERDPGVRDLRRRRVAARAEEEDVGGASRFPADALCEADLAAHLVGRPPAQDAAQRRAPAKARSL